jgi:lipoprotein-anchoring transpeptidase ErfK/SrfK
MLVIHSPPCPQSTGTPLYVYADQVTLFGHRYRIVVGLSEHRIRVFHGEDPVLDAPVAMGKQDTPTPGGVYYIKELLRPPYTNSVYGSYAYGLSGFSNVLESFNGGEGVIGIQGTNDPSVIGRDVSSGCIRMKNEDIEKLVPILRSAPR